MAEFSLDEAIERGVKRAFEKPLNHLGGHSLNEILDGFLQGKIVPVVRCRDCRFFEVKDHWGDWRGVPILAASDCPTCTKWGGADGCMTQPDGYCFMGEPKEG